MIEIIIATYNRLSQALILANELVNSSFKLKSVFIIDSSDNNVLITNTNTKIKIVKTIHKNQPYQRYLGYCLTDAPFLLFLDDDMSIIDKGIIDKVVDVFMNSNYVAINIPFDNFNNFIEIQPKGLLKSNNAFKKFIGIISGYPEAKPNKYIHNGIRGRRLIEENIDFLSGGVFAAKRDCLYKNFNMQLFSIYERRLGKGEDGILGYTISLQGPILAYRDKGFVHNDFDDSTYSNSQRAYSMRVLYSRLYLSCEYYRLKNSPLIYGYLRFIHYALGRFLGSMLSLIIKPTIVKKDIFLGNLDAIVKSIKFVFDIRRKSNFLWIRRVLNDKKSWQD